MVIEEPTEEIELLSLEEEIVIEDECILCGNNLRKTLGVHKESCPVTVSAKRNFEVWLSSNIYKFWVGCEPTYYQKAQKAISELDHVDKS